MFDFMKRIFKSDKAAPAATPVQANPTRVPDESIVTIRNGINKKKQDLRKLRETLNGCLPPDEQTDENAEPLARLAMAIRRR